MTKRSKDIVNGFHYCPVVLVGEGATVITKEHCKDLFEIFSKDRRGAHGGRAYKGVWTDEEKDWTYLPETGGFISVIDLGERGRFKLKKTNSLNL